MFGVDWTRHRFVIGCLLSGVVACADVGPEQPQLGTTQIELDEIGTPPAGAELLVLASGTEQRALDHALDALGAHVVHRSWPRLLVVAGLPDGADSVLRAAGIVRRFARAVSATELPGLSVAEGRFVRVFSNRYYPATTPRLEQIVPTRAVRKVDEPFEQTPPASSRARTLAAADTSPEDQERNVFVPYASGRVVVSIIMPESNGRAEPSTEDWNEDSIVETYAKVQAALEGIARHEPNSKLDFVQHYESAPAPGGLEGTVDVDWEYGKRVAEGANLGATYAQIFSRLLGREIGEYEYYEAQREYLNALRDRYSADGAYIVFVAANQNYTAGFRAYAYFNGPITTLDTSYGFEVFMHEFGHIFGAYDEYCPDACLPPSSTAGYLGVVNANAQYRPGPWGGIQGGRGESQPSLMMGNVINGVNGYTRGAWGWIDTDGDGLLEVRDTQPQSELTASLVGGVVHLTGRVVDLPATPLYAIPYSVNRLSALHLRPAGSGDDAWLRFELPEATRGRELIDLTLGALPAGSYQFEVRAENSVGNLEATPRLVALDVPVGPRNGTPLVSLETEQYAVSPASRFTLRAHVYDPEGHEVRARFDLDGDGRYDTPFGRALSVTSRAARAGKLTVGVEVIDDAGRRARAQTSLYVLARNAPARAQLGSLPSPIVGALEPALHAVGKADDPERGPVALNFRVERDDAERSESVETGFGSADTYDARLTTPPALVTRAIDISSLDKIDPYATVFDAERIDANVIALALGQQGVMFVDLTDPRETRMLARLDLQVDAFDLTRVGDKLFVLGDKLTVVDVHDPKLPVELPQARISRGSHSVSSDGDWPISEEPTKSPLLVATWHERIEHVGLDLTLDHPNLSELVIVLETPSGQRIELFNHAKVARGVRRLRFNERSHPQLATLLGTLAQGEFRLSVIDDVVDGDSGTLRATLSFGTSHRAFEAVSGASQIVGAYGAQQLLVAGEGLALINIARPQTLTTAARLDAAPIGSAVLRGDRVFALARPIDEAKDGQDWSPFLHGLYAVDVTPWRLRVRRVEPDVVADSLAVVGSRFYFRTGERDSLVTQVADQARFLAGQKYLLAESSLPIGPDVLGDDRTLWSVWGAFERIDVSNPDKLNVLERYDYPYAATARFFDDRTAFVVGAASELSLVDLTSRTSVVSEVYRVTVEAKDAQGAVTSSSRSVHVVPYDHPPEISGARLISGTTSRDTFELEVMASDLDSHPSWDGLLAVRVDWEGDGAWDGSWQGVYDTISLTHQFAQGGDYNVRLQARDGFYGLSKIYEFPLHVEQYVPVPCVTSDACPKGEYCELSYGGTCGEHGRGMCERVRNDCFGSIDVVCGCDGATYRNACEAQAAGASVAQSGLCPGEVTVCGGKAGAECSVAGMFCRYPVGETPDLSCGAGDTTGECAFAADVCFFGIQAGPQPRFGHPVCGCDDVTYPSACEAEKAGVSIKKQSSCEPDCRDLGCGEGQVCQRCFINWSCLPEGAMC